MAPAIESGNERVDASTSNPFPQVSWKDIDWKVVDKHVERLKDRIYKAIDEGNFRKAKNLQKLAIKSFHVKLYAMRHVTVKSSGKDTPGIDGKVYVTNEAREELCEQVLGLDWSSYHPKPVKRVEIPKANGKMRPLGIPTIFDRVVQTIVKTAMEPEWECKFHGNSHGFRPGRCCQDAIEQIKDVIKSGNGEYILDADLSGCFDNIAHAPLLTKLHLFKSIVHKWLKCGTYIDGRYHKSFKGTPQGGAISPLLANIALSALDYKFTVVVTFKDKKRRYRITLIRYADDFVILARDRKVLLALLPYLERKLADLGLSLNRDKTKLVHKSQGFKFLGFHLIQHPGRTLWVQPDKSAIKRHLREVKIFIDSHKQAKTDDLIRRLNKKILGWARYYRYSRIHVAFPRVDKIIWDWIWWWCRRRHPRKGRKWIRARYFPFIGGCILWSLTGDTLTLAKTSTIKRQTYRWRVSSRSYLDPRCRASWKSQSIITRAHDLNLNCFPFS